MDKIGSSDIVDINSLKTWNESCITKNDVDLTIPSDPIFKSSPEINNKIALWCGSIYKLQADAIAISINNFIDGKLSVESSVIYKLAGSNYARSFMNLVLGCKTSEIRVTEGYNLPCYHVLHTVSPRYNQKYESAAVNAIYNCYRNSLLTSIDLKIRKIGFSTLHITKYPFPDDIAIHITARTIRRFLEKHSEYVDKIVLQITPGLVDLYNEIMPIYFPRNEREEFYSVNNMPDDIGNEDGQPMLPNREIRISAFPYGPTRCLSESEDSEREDDPNFTKFSEMTKESKRALSKIHVAPALIRESISYRYHSKLPDNIKNFEDNALMERKLERLLRVSKKMDMSDLVNLHVFYQCGKDIYDQPILLVIEKNIPTNIENRRNEIMAFVIGTLEKITKGNKFSIIYSHTLSEFHPSRRFLSDIYNIFKLRYSKLLNCICMVHPTLYNRGLNWIFTTFNAPDLKSKLYNVTNLRQLYRIVNPSILELPDFIYQYDKQVGGSNSSDDLIAHGITRSQASQNVPTSIPTVINEEL